MPAAGAHKAVDGLSALYGPLEVREADLRTTDAQTRLDQPPTEIVSGTELLDRSTVAPEQGRAQVEADAPGSEAKCVTVRRSKVAVTHIGNERAFATAFR